MAGFEPLTGHRMKMYRNTATPATPTWATVSEVGDVSISDLTRGLAELKRRANDFTKNLPTLIQSIGIEFRLHYGLGATAYTAIRNNFFNATVEEWAVMGGDITVSGVEGLRCPVLVENFPFDQPLEDVAGHDVRLAIGYMVVSSTEIDPSWYIIP
jgi:hypothetical protein